jgi:hypothetical protein
VAGKKKKKKWLMTSSNTFFFFFQNLAVKSCFFFGTIRKRNNKAKEHTHTHTHTQIFKNKKGLTEYFQKISVVNASPGIDPFFLFLLFQEERERERKKSGSLVSYIPDRIFF